MRDLSRLSALGYRLLNSQFSILNSQF